MCKDYNKTKNRITTAGNMADNKQAQLKKKKKSETENSKTVNAHIGYIYLDNALSIFANSGDINVYRLNLYNKIIFKSMIEKNKFPVIY